MKTEKYFSQIGHGEALIWVLALFLYNSYVFAAKPLAPVFRQEEAGPLISETSPMVGAGSPGYKIVSLTHISAEQGKNFLDELGIGTVSKFPGSNTLLITADSSELIKATAILALVDTEQQFAVKMLSPVGGLGDLPSNQQIAANVGNISIGTFSNPPIGAPAAGAIVAAHNDTVVVIAPAGQLEKIVYTIEQLQRAPTTAVIERPEPKEAIPEPEEVPLELMPPSEVVTPPLRGVGLVVQRYEPEPLPNGDETLKLSLPEKLTIVDLLGLVGQYLHLDFMYDPTQIRGDVTLKLHGKYQGDLRVKDLYPLLESVLKFRGFGMTRRGNLITIVPVAQIPDIDPVLLSEDKGKVERGDVIVTRIFQLEYVDTASAQNFLTAMKLATTVTPIPDTGTLVVTGYAYRMPRIEELLDIIDIPGEPKEFRFRQLKFTMAETLASKVKTLADELGTVSIDISAPSAEPAIQRRRGESTAAYRRRLEAARRSAARRTTPTPEPTKPAVYLDTDERTNRILMIGLAEQLDVVDALIDSLDVEQQDLRTMQLYKIENVDAEEVKRKLGELGIIGAGRETAETRITRPPQK